MKLNGVVLAALLFACAVVAGVCLIRYGQHPGAAAIPAPQPRLVQGMVGRKRPPFMLPDVHGDTRQVKEWNGRVLALNFWATWCPPCRKEIPEFVALQRKYGGRGLQFVGIALQKPADVRDFLREFHVNYPILTGEMPVIRVARAYGDKIGALPYTVIINRDGRIAFTKPGALSREQAEQEIRKLL